MAIIINNRKFPIVVDYDQAVEDLVKAGKYHRITGLFVSRDFPSRESGKIQIEIILVGFDHSICMEDAIRLMDKEGLRPATIKELLALGAQMAQGANYYELHWEYPIIALGSTLFSKGELAPQLEYHRHGLELISCQGEWLPSQRFATVRGHIENAESIRRDPITVISDPSWSVIVDHRKSIQQLAEEGKYYSGISYADVDKRFPSRKKIKVTVEMHLVDFRREITSEEAINEMSARRLRPANIKELLVFGPKLHLTGYELQAPSMVALGSVGYGVSGQKEVPLLSTFGGGVSWGLLTLPLDTNWGTRYRFVAVRKSR